MEFKLEQKVRVKKPVTDVEGDVLSSETLATLKACNFTGQVTQLQEGLVYVGFVHNDVWVTQVFEPEELEAV